MKDLPKFILTLGLVLVISIVFSACSQSENKNININDDTQEEVTIGYSALRISLPIFVAQEQGYFLEEGLNVQLERYDTAQPLMAALIAGNIDMAGYTALPITFNMMLRSQEELYFVTTMLEDQKHRISYLIVPKDTPESFSIADLKGKKIGILPTIAYKAWIEQILKANNVDLADVELVQIAPNLSPAALESGQIDALFTNDPAATTVLQQGIGRLYSEEVQVPKVLGEPFIFGAFNIRKDYADKNIEATQKTTRAINKAISFIKENPLESKEMMKEYLHESQQEFVKFYPDALYQISSEVSPESLQDIADKYLEIGIISNKLEVKHLIK
ncbi:hypothetical protein COB57_01830 [Candidatus Peregrinibacteria bacterium]|nr:MAG: hypothetical protein COB57_01830 [Candidatus Peregrinibacteria bacterium]